MTDAREIIAKRIAGPKALDWADAVINALNTAGFRILGPDEVDQVTVERALEVVNEIAARGYSAAYRGGALDCDAAIRALGRKA